MARKYLVSLDLTKNEIQNAVVQVLATAPSSPVEGQIYYDSVDKVAKIYNGSAWVKMEQNVAIDFGEVTDIVASAPGDTAAAGSTGEVADAGHRHARESFATTASTQAIGDAAAAGSGSDVSRGDHKHAMPSFGSVTAQTTAGASSGNGSASTIARSDHTHGTPAHTGTEHSTISLSSLAAPTADLSAGSYKLTNVATPTADTDAANKGYVDGAIAGLSWKDSVRVATTTAGTLASSFENGDTVDGVTLATGDRILLKNQSAGAENGIYVVKASGAPDRATDANTAAELRGAAVFIEEGDTLAGTQWILTTDNITLDSTALTFVQFGSSTTYTWGNGLGESGGTVSVNTGTSSATGLKIVSDIVQVDYDYVPHYKVFTITGDGSTVDFDLTHSFGNQFVSVQVIEETTLNQVEPDIVRTSTTATRVTFATAPANAKVYKAIVVG